MLISSPSPGIIHIVVTVGAAVTAESVVASVSVGNGTADIPAGAGGTVTEMFVEEGSSVVTGQPVMMIA